MGVRHDDRVAIVGSRDREEIAHALAAECELLEAPTTVLFMDDFLARPAREYPEQLSLRLDEIRPTVSFLAVSLQEGELAFRMPYRDHVLRLQARHAHMPGISERLMEEGMAADYNEVARITADVTSIVRESRDVEAQSPAGTDIRARLDPGLRRWYPDPGIIHRPGEFGNLPAGETFTSPIQVDGVIAAEVLGDYLSQRYGVLEHSVLVHVEKSWIRKVECEDEDVRSDLESYLSKDQFSKRAGEFAVGTNIGLSSLSGNLLQDEKIPGVHVAFGDPYAGETGADWECPTHIDMVGTRFTVKVDSQYLMRDGKFVY